MHYVRGCSICILLNREISRSIDPPTNQSRLCAKLTVTMADDSSSQIFDPRKYLNHFYSYLNKKPGEEPEVLEFILIKLHEYLNEVPAGYRDTLVNFGCGPTVHCDISPSAVFKNIICAEYTEANRRELGKWLSNDEDKFDWSVFFKYVAVLEGKSESDWKELEERVRSTTKEIVPCDVLKDPVMDHPSQPFDAILTTLCIEETCTDFESYKANIQRLVGVLKPGGYLFIGTMLGMSFYRVQGQVIRATPLTEEQVKEALTNAGLVVEKASLYTSTTDDPIEKDEADFTHLSFILAKKI